MREASEAGGLHGDTLGKVLSKENQSPTLDTIEKLARGLNTTPAWLAFGITLDDGRAKDPNVLCVDRQLLRQAVEFVLVKEGSSEEQAALVADIFPEALSGRAVDAVDGDPFLSFQVHLQFEGQRSAHQGRQ